MITTPPTYRCSIALLGAMWLTAFLISHVVQAQEVPQTDPGRQYEGNWEAILQDYPKKGQVWHGHFSLSRPYKILRNGLVIPDPRDLNARDRVGVNYNYTLRPIENPRWMLSRPRHDWFHTLDGNFELYGGKNMVTVNGSATIKHPDGGTLVVRSVGLNELRGKWTWGNESGDAVWKRTVPKITEIEFHWDHYYGRAETNRVAYGKEVGRIEGKYPQCPYWHVDTIRLNRPKFIINIYGENLWGFHIAWVEGVDLESWIPKHITREGVEGPESVIGLQLGVNIWTNATPGRKAIRLDDFTIPFDLVINGFPEDRLPPELRFVRFTENGPEHATALKHGDEFTVEAHYRAKPARSPQTIELAGAEGGPRIIEMEATADGKVFRSKTRLRLTSPAANPGTNNNPKVRLKAP